MAKDLRPYCMRFFAVDNVIFLEGISVLLRGLQPTTLSLEENSNFFKSSNKSVVLQLIKETSIRATILFLKC
jgi:hypothetical protein